MKYYWAIIKFFYWITDIGMYKEEIWSKFEGRLFGQIIVQAKKALKLQGEFPGGIKKNMVALFQPTSPLKRIKELMT